ncbi:MAG: Gfo/Idh/MocA family oxidoreductase [Chitinophagaceae bacterium]|nr:Gfo/Idh/MocA family oxidoreductase [Chitinophagaceae bacterium]
MNPVRRSLLKLLGLGAGTIAAGFKAFTGVEHASCPDEQHRSSNFNMSGYRAPKLDTVRVGVIGLGNRGAGSAHRMSMIENVEIKALCDKRPEKIKESQQRLKDMRLPAAVEYTGENGWKDLCQRDDIDLIYIVTPWKLHTPMAVYAMNHGKHAVSEVPVAVTLDECWQLVETSEKTKKHCMMLENCCYDFFELLTLNMARQGLFGEIVHAEGAYIHQLINSSFGKETYTDMWRLKENMSRNGNLYPTHGLGPVAQCLNINRGDQMSHLVSMSCDDFMMNDLAKQKAAADPFYNQFVDRPNRRGNMNTTLIRTNRGKTIMLQHDISSLRPYSRIHLISGTKGAASKYPSPERISFHDENWLTDAEMKALYDQYTLPIVRHIGDLAQKIGGHGGMDFMMEWRLVDCLRNGLPLDQDVYDGALWSAIAPLSEASVKQGSKPLKIPDFTRGNWKTNAPVNLTLDGGGNTRVRAQNS